MSLTTDEKSASTPVDTRPCSACGQPVNEHTEGAPYSWETCYLVAAARLADLRGRIDRTLDYLSEVARVADTEILARVALASIKSLDTPVAQKPDPEASSSAANAASTSAVEVVERTLYDLGYTGLLGSDAVSILDALEQAGHPLLDSHPYHSPPCCVRRPDAKPDPGAPS